jgi:hypothetical protein
MNKGSARIAYFPFIGNQATGNRQQATGNRQQATGNRQQALYLDYDKIRVKPLTGLVWVQYLYEVLVLVKYLTRSTAYSSQTIRYLSRRTSFSSQTSNYPVDYFLPLIVDSHYFWIYRWVYPLDLSICYHPVGVYSAFNGG